MWLAAVGLGVVNLGVVNLGGIGLKGLGLFVVGRYRLGRFGLCGGVDRGRLPGVGDHGKVRGRCLGLDGLRELRDLSGVLGLGDLFDGRSGLNRLGRRDRRVRVGLGELGSRGLEVLEPLLCRERGLWVLLRVRELRLLDGLGRPVRLGSVLARVVRRLSEMYDDGRDREGRGLRDLAGVGGLCELRGGLDGLRGLGRFRGLRRLRRVREERAVRELRGLRVVLDLDDLRGLHRFRGVRDLRLLGGVPGLRNLHGLGRLGDGLDGHGPGLGGGDRRGVRVLLYLLRLLGLLHLRHRRLPRLGGRHLGGNLRGRDTLAPGVRHALGTGGVRGLRDRRGLLGRRAAGVRSRTLREDRFCRHALGADLHHRRRDPNLGLRSPRRRALQRDLAARHVEVLGTRCGRTGLPYGHGAGRGPRGAAVGERAHRAAGSCPGSAGRDAGDGG